MSFLKKYSTGIFTGAAAIGVLGLGYYLITSERHMERKNPYEYNIDYFKKTGGNTLYRVEKEIRPPMKELHAIALDPADQLMVAGDRKCLIYDTEGIISAGLDLPAPVTCAASGPGEVYMGFRDHVAVYQRNGTLIRVWDSQGPDSYFTSIAVTEKDIYVADAGNRIVLRYDKSGLVSGRIGEKDPARDIPGFIVPGPYFDLAIDPDQTLWVVNPGRHALENYTSDGNLRGFWQKSSMRPDGFSGCCNPTHIAILPNGSFVTSEKGLVRVKVHDQTGQFTGLVAGPDQFDDGTVGLDLAVDSKARIYVLNPKKGVVTVYEKTGE